MATHVIWIILIAAIFHALWSALLKLASIEPFTKTVLFSMIMASLGTFLVLFSGLPSIDALPYLIFSSIFQVCYNFSVIKTLDAGDLAQTYGIARGGYVLLTAIVSAIFPGDVIGIVGWLGLLVLSGGVFLMSLRGAANVTHFERRAVGFALLTAVMNSGCLVLDGVGARVSGNVHAYAGVVFTLQGIITLLVAAIYKTRIRVPKKPIEWAAVLVGGALAFGVYWIAIWAMTLEKIPIVAAFRETSVIFGALFAILILKEQLNKFRVVAGLMILFGLILIRLQSVDLNNPLGF